MAEHLGHDLGVSAGRQLQGREGVAQVVEADRRQLRPAQERLKLAGRDVTAQQRLAGAMGEDEVVVGHPMADGQQPLGLVRAMGSQLYSERVDPGRLQDVPQGSSLPAKVREHRKHAPMVLRCGFEH